MLIKSKALTESKVYRLTLVFGFALLLGLAAQVKVPLFFTPVPLTLQTLVVYLAIRSLKKKAFLPVALYLLAGALGFPVFAASSWGLAYLAGPTGGYLIGFLAACLILPFIFTGSASFSRNLICFLSAALIIYGFGLTWLVVLFNLPLPAALITGFYPFLPGEALKIIIAAILTKRS